MTEPYVGEIRMFAGQFAPRGWAFADGQLLAVGSNDALFSLYGTTFGGDGRQTFGLPDLRGRVPIHAGAGPGLTPRNIGAKIGSEKVTITETTLASHQHTLEAVNDTNVNVDPSGRVLGHPVKNSYRNPPDNSVDMSGDTLAQTGGGRSHENMMPFQGINYIVALYGVYPSRH